MPSTQKEKECRRSLSESVQMGHESTNTVAVVIVSPSSLVRFSGEEPSTAREVTSVSAIYEPGTINGK